MCPRLIKTNIEGCEWAYYKYELEIFAKISILYNLDMPGFDTRRLTLMYLL